MQDSMASSVVRVRPFSYVGEMVPLRRQDSMGQYGCGKIPGTGYESWEVAGSLPVAVMTVLEGDRFFTSEDLGNRQRKTGDYQWVGLTILSELKKSTRVWLIRIWFLIRVVIPLKKFHVQFNWNKNN